MNNKTWRILTIIVILVMIIIFVTGFEKTMGGALSLGVITGILFCLLDYYVRKIETSLSFKKIGYRVLTVLLLGIGFLLLSTEIISDDMIISFLAAFFFTKEAYEYEIGKEF